MSQVKHISYYTNVMQSWSSSELGKKPTEAELSLAHVFGRPGKQSLAVALALRDGGVTGAQIKAVSALVDGKPTPQLNHMRDLVKARLFTREAVTGAYALTLAPKGQQFVDLHGAAKGQLFVDLYGAMAAEKLAGKAEKAKPAKQARKVAGKPKGEGKPVEVTTQPVTETPTSEPATVTEGQPAEIHA